MPSISIIVPVFDGIRFLTPFLNSLAEAAPPDAEVVFVDDASVEPVFDLIPDRLSPFKNVTKLRNDRNRGYSATVNRGFANSTGDIVIQLNTDLVLDRQCIAAMVDLIVTTPNIGVVGSKQILPTTGLVRHIGMAFGHYSLRHIYLGMRTDHPLCTKTRRMQFVSGATVAMTRTVLDQIGPLDESYYNTHENFDHCLKAHACGFANYTCAQSITYHWVSQSGPARFARVTEDDGRFWATWGTTRQVDLERFVTEALDHQINCHPEFLAYGFEPLSLCRSGDETILIDCVEQKWKGATAKMHQTRAFNSHHSKFWLSMELPHHAMLNPAPYIYLVDEISQLAENVLWFEARSRIVESELIMDVNASVVTSKELLELYGKRPE